MASFSHQKYDCSAYAANRPSPPKALFDTILAYHQASQNLCIDLGCGHGSAARGLASHFGAVLGVDPSKSMLKEAREQTEVPNVQYRQSRAESLPFIMASAVDLVIAFQAAHWFDPDPLWKELARIVRPGGTVAFWNWGNYVVTGHPHASRVLRHFSSQDLAPFWPQPGITVWDDRMCSVECRDLANWTDLLRLESQPTTGNSPVSSKEEGIQMHISQTLGRLEALLRTWSAVHEWRRAHPDTLSLSEGGDGDLVDCLMQEMIDAEEEWRDFTRSGGNWRDIEVNLEVRSILLMARRI